jgi:transposase
VRTWGGGSGREGYPRGAFPLTAGAHVLVKTRLNRVHPLQSFVYGLVAFVGDDLHVEVRPRKRSRPRCGGCGRRGPTYDTARKARAFAFVPLWGLAVTLWYCMRRVACPRCGLTTEQVPWAEGKHRTCNAYRQFLARWATRLSWSEVATIFGTTWGVVYRSIQWVVAYGLAHRVLDHVQAIGVDEIAVWTGHKYLTVVYQIDRGARRLLWIGRERTEATFRQFFAAFGATRTAALQVIASDMWQPFLKVIAEKAPQAIHVLDRYHVVAKLNRAIDEVRAKETKALARQGYEPVLTRSRWCFLKRRERLTPGQRRKLRDVLQYDLKTVRAYLLKEAFESFWTYTTPRWAAWFLDRWCTRAQRSRLEPFKKFAKTLRRHRALLLNWFRAKKEISSGTVEGLNLNAKLAVRKARGFRSEAVLKTALYHQLGKLPEPPSAHRFC